MWINLVWILSGIIIGMIVFLRLKSPDTIINDNTRIGKMKQRGQGNAADVTVDPDINGPDEDADTPESRKEARLIKRLRRIRSRERQDKTESG
ncbi:MAG: hypothetical protein ACOYMF_05645 [Bacteroidales bacterium]